ncbi:ty3-gypsy retrotransposon protein [Tanacetum coccineum]
MKWLPKLMGYDYEVVYKQGKDNAMADALSRREDVGALFALSTTSVSNDKALWKDLMSYFHDGAIGRHSGVKATTHKRCSVFYWKGLRKQVNQWVKECLVCQRCKPDLSAYPRLLQPLPIPKTMWSSISMDFIEGLPKSHGCTVILVVVDRLTKYGHFIPLSHPFIALQVAQVFLDQVCKLHPESIVSDMDKTEVVNRCLEGYLRCMTGENPKEWYKWLPLAELWYNSNYHSSIATTPFEALSLIAKEQAIEMMKFHLSRAQNRMKQ